MCGGSMRAFCGRSPGERLPDHRFVAVHCDDPTKFRWAENEDMWEKADELAAEHHRLGAVAFQQLQQTSGPRSKPIV